MPALMPESPSGTPCVTDGVQAWIARAYQRLSSGDLQLAGELCRRVLQADPLNANALRLQGIIEGQQGRIAEGLRLVEQAIDLEPGNPGFHFTRGQMLMRMGNPQAAAAAYQASAQLETDDPRSARHWILALIACSRLPEAGSAADAALLRFPACAELLDAAGQVYMAQGRYPAASRVLQQACSVSPTFPDAWGNLAILHEQSNRLDAALDLIQEGLQRWPAHPMLRFIRSRCLRRQGEYTQARSVLQELLNGEISEKLRVDVEYELGWCAHGLGETNTAYACFSQANLRAEQLPVYGPKPGMEFLDTIATLKTQFTPDWVAAWQALASTDFGHEPAFILGFPRSGTTLLDTMLGAHADIQVLEEPATIQAILQRLNRYTGGYPAALAGLTSELQSELRGEYFLAAGLNQNTAGGRKLIDKSPFNTVHAGLIHRLFPRALQIFVARHPCDVCLSCFMNNFEINSGTRHFTRLETSVRLYCQVMDLWFAYRELLPLNYKLVRYEDLVHQPEQVLRRLLADLGVDWSDQVLRHAGHALNRGHIPTPSYAQVIRPVNTDACERWKRYAEVMRPFLVDLQPYIEAFGYAA
ncbi:MAG: sulfotransferase [Gammaproteobacteria bacterium]|nr:sulfotransferase [Gammaproteobacteria bacterium]MDE2345899.1 sulfotransferase [Gammaproteobacteria bacterium]